MVRRSSRRQASDNGSTDPTERQERVLPDHVRDRQRAVAEREAARLARPEQRTHKKLAHADRKKSAVTSTPFGINSTHLKRKNDDDDDPKESRSDYQGWCGPFSVARQMIAEREEARRQREAEQEAEQGGESHPLDELVDAVALERKRKAHPSLLWKSKVSVSNSDGGVGVGAGASSVYAKRQKRMERMARGKSKIPSLFQLCIDFVVNNFEYVESLGDVDNDIRSTIAKEVVARKKLDVAAFEAIAEPGIEALEMVDCTEVTQTQLSQTLGRLLPEGLRYLVLDQSGRCFGPETVQAMLTAAGASTTATAKPSSELFALSIGGAYLLKDNDAAKLLETFASSLSSIEFKACPLLGNEFCQSLSKSYSVEGTKLLELSLEDIDLSSHLTLLLSTPLSFQFLKTLTLRRIGGLTDDIVIKFMEMAGTSLETLDVSYNHELTDICLSPIRKFNPMLRSLHLAGLKELTAAGLEALFTHRLVKDVKDLGPPPMLWSLNLASCHHEAITDDVLQAVLHASSRKRDGFTTAATTANPGDSLSLLGGIVHLDIQGSSVVTDTTMENLVNTSSASLQELNVSFCPKISDQGLGFLVDKISNQLSKIEIWGCAQITDDFLDGHRRVDDSSLNIVGAWMKKSGTSALR